MIPNPADMLSFAVVAERRSFTLAAEVLGKTTSAVSQSIARLERDLNCKLLHRTTRSLSLTDEGGRALAHFTDMRIAYESVISDLSDNLDAPDGLLTVTAPHTLSASRISRVLTIYCQRYPDVRIKLLSDDAELNAVERRIDVAIRVGMPTSQEARVTKIGELFEGLYTHQSYLAKKHGVPKDLSEIQDWDHIANEWQGSPVRLQTLDAETIKITPRYRCNSAHDTLSLVENGAGIALLADSMVHESPLADNLVSLFTVSSTPIFAVHHFGKNVPAKVSAFLDVLKAQFRNL